MAIVARRWIARTTTLELDDSHPKYITSDYATGSWIAQVNNDAVLSKVLGTVKTMTGIKPTLQYDMGSFKGFAFDAPETVVDMLSAIGALKHVEPDTMMSINMPIAEATEEPAYLQDRAMVTQSNAAWGLARISNKKNGTTNYNYDNSAGANVVAYMIDSGINANHTLFEGRATQGPTFVDGEDGNDNNGHGSHTAGTVGSSNYGVAKKATLIGVKVLNVNGTGKTSITVKGIEWAVNDAKAKGITGKCVMSISIGGNANDAANNAVKAATDAGIFVAVSAGNNNVDASQQSPASAPSACTVGATDTTDTKASFSNYGSMVDIWAPGVSIKSLWKGSNTAVMTASGTSQATPHVAGLAAYLIGQGVRLSPTDMCQKIKDMSQRNLIKGLDANSVNYLAYNGNGL
ncbi:unnamed protein product [Zymoseptoria tritici ST99CH_1A5]|uniref:Peptidase S8/S53 domain-containing protein n=1 Tax=Zymoseptoria tritici ST99CH_1A5 TaxID=1276529 RepID=A0A1Y6LGF4_ZYMTR|nr:unnamed protein product [Zymoseptoria tritici ST99CH_1A5]